MDCASRSWTFVVVLLGLLSFGLGVGGNARADGDIEKRGDAYVVYLPADADYYEVVDRLKTEVLAQNWEITDVQDLDIGLRQYKKITQNKVISVCKSQLLAKAITEDPFISLVVPCRFTVFRDQVNQSEDYHAVSGKIVVGFYDPVAEAKAIGIKQYQAAQQATDELKQVLQILADFYKK